MTTKISTQTYIPLYRKYRPQQFSDVVGQAAVIQTLKNAVTGGQVAHAYLLCGPRGTGKTSTARILAKSLNCLQGGPTVTPCQTCQSCTSITQGNGLDVVEIDAASNNRVDDVRELIETCQFTPMMGHYKIYIIDEVHMLSAAAFNALLKTLEEPPPNVVFIFATTEAHKVLPTIISRCQRFDFSRIRMPELVAHLRTVADAEAIHIVDEALETIARHARGGLRDALGMLDQVGVLSQAQPGTVIEAADVSRFLGAVGEETLIALLQAIAAQHPGELLAVLDELQQQGMEPRLLVQNLAQMVRNLMIAAACKQDDAEKTRQLMGVNETLFAQIQALSDQFKAEEYPQLLHQLNTLDAQLRYSATPQLWLETGLLGLAYRHEMATVAELQQRIAALENALHSGETARPAAVEVKQVQLPHAQQPQAVSTAPTIPPVNFSETPHVSSNMPTMPPQPVAAPISASEGLDWTAIVQAIASIPTKTMVQQHCQLLGVDNGTLVVGCSAQGILNTLKSPSKLIHLKKAIEAVSGQTLEVRLEVGSATSDMPSTGPIATSAVSVSHTPSLPPPLAPPIQQSPEIQEASPPPVSTSPAAPVKRPALTLDDVPQEPQVPSHMLQPNDNRAPLPAQPKEALLKPMNESVASDNADGYDVEAIEEAKQHVATLLQGKPI